jgi:hypothetical protein
MAMITIIVLSGCTRFQDKPLSATATAQQLEARSLGDADFKSFLETNLGQSFTSWPLTNYDFSSLTLAAFYFHPSLDVARARNGPSRKAEPKRRADVPIRSSP